MIVSITKDEFIKKGPGRPVFNQNQRFEYLKSIKLIDEVYMSEGDSASEAIRTIKPNYFIKGAEYINEKQDKSKKIIEEKKLVKKYGGEIKFTLEETFSSSKIINDTNMILNEKQRSFLNSIKKKFSYKTISKSFNDFSKLNVLVIGEIIIDKYCFGNALGKSGKEPYLVFNEKFTENYLGGSAYVARNVSPFVKKINVISPFGFENKNINFLKEQKNKNITFNLTKPYKGYSSIIKKRFVDRISNYKLFGSYIVPEVNSLKKSETIIKKISKISRKSDMVICCDYGHNFLNDKIINSIKKIEKKNFCKRSNKFF